MTFWRFCMGCNACVKVRGHSTTRTTMSLPRRAVLLVSSLVSCTVTGVWSFVPASPTLARRCPTSFVQEDTATTPTAAGSSSYVVCLSSSASPFEGIEHDNSEDDIDVVQREAEMLEEMIRGSRGIQVEAIAREWREEMLRVLGDEGETLCLEAYEGYLDRGRGAIFVNVDMGLSSNRDGHYTAPCHAVFRSLEEVVMERSSRVKPADQMEIIQRCQAYDPEAAFVVVFGHKGMLGVQVIRPSLAPGELHRTRRAA